MWEDERRDIMDYLIRFIQMHETFRRPETEALAELHGIEIEWLFYSDDVSWTLWRMASGRSGKGRCAT